MKPDWKDAPEWANWLAMDGDGDWVWFEHQPIWDKYMWIPPDDSGYMVANGHGCRYMSCRDTLEPHP